MASLLMLFEHGVGTVPDSNEQLLMHINRGYKEHNNDCTVNCYLFLPF